MMTLRFLSLVGALLICTYFSGASVLKTRESDAYIGGSKVPPKCTNTSQPNMVDCGGPGDCNLYEVQRFVHFGWKQYLENSTWNCNQITQNGVNLGCTADVSFNLDTGCTATY
jgi:hypothetical protein